MQINITTRKCLLYSMLLFFISFTTTACDNQEEQNTRNEADMSAQLIVKSHQAKTTAPPSTAQGTARIFSSITPTEAYQILQARKDILFVDVRSLQEREQLSIPGSTYLPIGAIFKGTISLPQDKAILLFCAVGGRSYAAAKILSARGQHEVYNLRGGIKAWLNAGLPVLSGPGK